MNFAKADLNDREAVDRVLDELSRVARRAWMQAAERAEGITPEAPASIRADPVSSRALDVAAAIGEATALAAEANLHLLKTQADMAQRFFTASFDAYELLSRAIVERNSSAVEQLMDELRRLETEARALLEDRKAIESAVSALADNPSARSKRVA